MPVCEHKQLVGSLSLRAERHWGSLQTVYCLLPDVSLDKLKHPRKPSQINNCKAKIRDQLILSADISFVERSIWHFGITDSIHVTQLVHKEPLCNFPFGNIHVWNNTNTITSCSEQSQGKVIK